MEDMELVRAYAAERSESAFRTLVERHLPLVFSAALRRLGDPALAEDVCQVVFLLLARKAAKLPEKTLVAGWLYRTACHMAAKALRQEGRRRRREQEAMVMQNAEPDIGWDQMAPFLDEAMAQLGDLDRGAVLLRYFQNKSLRDIGLALGINDDAAQKRVSRALDKLRGLLLKRGVVVSAVAATGLLATRAAQFAPPGLGRAASTAIIGRAALSPSAYALLFEASRRSLRPQLTTIGAAALVVTGVGWARFVMLTRPKPVVSATALPLQVPNQTLPVSLPEAPSARATPKIDPSTNLTVLPGPDETLPAPVQDAGVTRRPAPVRSTTATNLMVTTQPVSPSSSGENPAPPPGGAAPGKQPPIVPVSALPLQIASQRLLIALPQTLPVRVTKIDPTTNLTVLPAPDKTSPPVRVVQVSRRPAPLRPATATNLIVETQPVAPDSSAENPAPTPGGGAPEQAGQQTNGMTLPANGGTSLYPANRPQIQSPQAQARSSVARGATPAKKN